MSTLNTINLEFIEAESILDTSGIIGMVADWAAEDGTKLTNETLSDLRAVISGWLATGLARFPLTDENVARALRGNGMGHATPELVRGFTSFLLETVDDAGHHATKRQLAFTNALLRAQLDVTRCVDGPLSIALGSLSADGSEYTVATLQSSDLLRNESVPNIIVGIAGHERQEHDTAAGELIREVLENGRTLERVSGDLAYFPAVRPELVQVPLRMHGAKLVMTYAPQDEGRVLARSGDNILVEGRWYRDNLPTPLLGAMKDFHAAQQRNRKSDGRCVLDAGVEFALEKRRDALLTARLRYEVPAPESSEYEQTYAYGSSEWQMAFSDGLYENTSFKASFADTNAALAPTMTQYRGEAAHSFMTTLIIVSLNARRIADWKLYYALDEGNGVLVDEWYALYHLIVPRLQDAMAAWSVETQPSSLDIAGGHWTVDAEEADGWVADGAATVVEMTRATDDIAEFIVEKLVDDLRTQASKLLEEGGDARDLSRHASISLDLAFVDANPYAGDEDDVWSPVPAEGVLIAAQATIHPKWEWRHP